MYVYETPFTIQKKIQIMISTWNCIPT